MIGNRRAPQHAESYLNALTASPKTPGIQYLVVASDGVQFEYARGWADIRNRLPVDSATTMIDRARVLFYWVVKRNSKKDW